MLSRTTEISLDSVLREVSAMLPQGYRFVTMTCVDAGEVFDIYYHFDKDYELTNFLLRAPKGTELPSVSGVFFAAALAENEIRDLFGVTFRGLAVNYGGRFMLAEGAPATPLVKGAIAMKVTEPPKPNPEPAR